MFNVSLFRLAGIRTKFISSDLLKGHWQRLKWAIMSHAAWRSLVLVHERATYVITFTQAA